MANSGTSFDIDIGVHADGVEPAAVKLARMATSASEAAEAVKLAESSYKSAETTADRAAKAVERIGLAAEAQRGKLKTALEAGDARGADRAAAALQNLAAREAEAAAKATQAQKALSGEAAALDKVRQLAQKTAEQEKKLADATGSGNAKKTASALRDLGGPLGALGSKFFGLKDTVEDFTETLGSGTGAVAASVVGVSALTVGLIAAASAAALGVGAFAAWAVGLAAGDKLAKLGDKLKKNFLGVFSGLKVDKLLDGLETLANLFDKNTAAGNALKVLFESVFQPLIDGAAGFIPTIERAFIVSEIWALKAAIALKPYASTLLTVAEYVGVVMAVVVGGLAVAFAIAAAGAAAAVLVLAALGYAIVYLGGVAQDAYVAIRNFESGVVASITGGIQTAINWLKNLSLAQIGADMVNGLIAGITGAAGKLFSSVTSLGTGAIAAARNALDSHSPSRAFVDIGMDTGAGMAIGVDKSAGNVQSSLESMVAPPATSTGTASTSGSTGKGSAPNFSGATFVFNGVEGAEDAQSRFEAMLVRAYEGDATQLGLAT